MGGIEPPMSEPRHKVAAGGCSCRQALFHFIDPKAPDAGQKAAQPLGVELEQTGLVDGVDRLFTLSFFQLLPPLFEPVGFLFYRYSFLFQCACHDGPLGSR